DANGWQAKFDEVYSLKDGELVKYIPMPFIPERQAYWNARLIHFNAQAMGRLPDAHYLLFSIRENKVTPTSGLTVVQSSAKGLSMMLEDLQLNGTNYKTNQNMGTDVNGTDVVVSAGELRDLVFDGDWLVREDAKRDE